MKWIKKNVRVERYAHLLSHVEKKMDDRLHLWANWLQRESDQLSPRWKTILFLALCIGVSCVCAMVILNAVK